MAGSDGGQVRLRQRHGDVQPVRLGANRKGDPCRKLVRRQAAGRCRWAGEGGRLAERAEIEVAEREPVARHRRSCSLERGRVAEGRAALGVDRGVDGRRIAHEEHVLQDPERKRRAVAVIGRDGDACVGLRSCPGSERVVGPRPGRRCVLHADEQEALGWGHCRAEPGDVAAPLRRPCRARGVSTTASESPSQPLMLPVKVWLPLVADPTSWSSASSSFLSEDRLVGEPRKVREEIRGVLALVAGRVQPDLEIADAAGGHVADERRGRCTGRQDHESRPTDTTRTAMVTMPAIAHRARDPAAVGTAPSRGRRYRSWPRRASLTDGRVLEPRRIPPSVGSVGSLGSVGPVALSAWVVGHGVSAGPRGRSGSGCRHRRPRTASSASASRRTASRAG